MCIPSFIIVTQRLNFKKIHSSIFSQVISFADSQSLLQAEYCLITGVMKRAFCRKPKQNRTKLCGFVLVLFKIHRIK
ncbi:hypothetical protein BIV59_02990 [Bacillus sp. MUM 13]|nr:hypothetical protein BIV59_02990 [Bacillus sp. MUM 13]